MTGHFTKMHGLGNDFVIVDGRAVPVEMTTDRARAIADRKYGIGCDQLIVLENSDQADVRMRIFNSDGGEVEACGNATRCVVKLLGDTVSIETSGGMLSGKLAGDHVTVDMGSPRFEWDQIPLAQPMDTLDMPVGWEMLERPLAVNVGNPHVIFFVDDCDAVPLDRLGPIIENDPLFPERVNVNVATVADDHIRLHVWERGVGLTRACGTGACATAVAAIRAKLVTGPVRVELPGGSLTIDWTPGATIQMTGDATEVYRGTTDWGLFG